MVLCVTVIQGNDGFKVIPHIVFSLFPGTKLVSICRHCAGTIDGPVCYCDSGEQWVLGHPSYRFFFISRYKVSIHM